MGEGRARGRGIPPHTPTHTLRTFLFFLFSFVTPDSDPDFVHFQHGAGLHRCPCVCRSTILYHLLYPFPDQVRFRVFALGYMFCSAIARR